MSERRQELRALLETHYQTRGWSFEHAGDGTVRAEGLGVTWIGLPVLPEDLDDPGFEATLLVLGDQRTAQGRLCPLELLPAAECKSDLTALLDRLRLRERGHVEVYSVAA